MPRSEVLVAKIEIEEATEVRRLNANLTPSLAR
jgi:hypothetical protein